ncbi:unnamed protein product [Echinostoma caproni]|uniref:CRAL-TRIO domain-containing protein n=1 Tax=Echinostoma caproni TaxID=27848 RepID=A0A183AMB3_9TREM|nr:unnamed protein product [Echinostoma caproni]
MCGCTLLGLWRFVIWLDEWLVQYVKPYHSCLFECVIRMVLPGFPAPRPMCEFFTYYCLICPVEIYRAVTCRDRGAFHKLNGDAMCFFFKQLDFFDLDEVTGAMGWMPDWKRYMLTGKWPWDDKEDAGPGGDEDEEEDENEDEDSEDEDDDDEEG